MPDRGKLVVASILLLALGLAVFAWYWRWQQGHRAAEVWGPEASRLIRGARQTELLLLRPIAEKRNTESPDGEPESQSGPVQTLSISDAEYEVVATFDLARSPGLIHARHSLTEDASFVWPPAMDDCAPHWTHAMLLIDDDRSAIVAFEFECQLVCLVERQRVMEVVPRIAAGFQRVFERAQTPPQAGP